MPNLCTSECYDFLKQHYAENHDCEAIITDLCNCFDSHALTEFIEHLKKEYYE